YFIKERTATGFNLQANPHTATKIEGPESVSLNYLPKSDNPKADTEKFLKADFDLIWSPRLADIDPLVSKGYDTHHPRLGFTFFASLNSDTVDQQNRSYIQKLLNPNSFTYKDSWRKKPAFQLYLPNGPGRISDKEAEKIWTDIAKTPDPKVKKKQLTILLPSAFELTDAVNEKLTSAGYQTVLKKYRDFTEYANEIRTNTYDIVFANNDFSSIDLRGNIAVTFNPERPLILASKKNPQISNIVNGIVKETNYENRNSRIKELGKSLISDAYIIPIYYHEVLVLTKPGFDLSAWSQIVPEIGIWKVKKLKN
ncbi:MAG TPA: hypothetical protein VE954_03515, partial [Oligoflexus sp.]|uniref:hypothetical protein n=1 Tax=Oligoflexus sp. TaxID=1971216 RepID=UPI002D3B847D